MPLPIHLDPKIPLDVSQSVKDRLKRNESGQRSRVKAINKKLIAANNRVSSADQIDLLQIEKVDIVDTGERQNWTCACHEVPGWTGCYQRVDITKSGKHPASPVIMHIVATARGRGHTKHNVRIGRHECNAAINNKIESGEVAKTKRLRRKHRGLNADGTEYIKKSKPSIPSRPEGLQSRSNWGKQKKAWGKRSFSKKSKDTPHD